MAEKLPIVGTYLFKRGNKDYMESLLNFIPSTGEPVYEIDTGKLKIGDGKTIYANLSYLGETKEIDVLKERLDAFLADADLSAAAVDTLKEIQDMLQSNEFDLANLIKKIAEFEELHTNINNSIENVRQDFAVADQKIIEDSNVKFDKLDMDILVAKAEAVNEAKVYSDELSTKFANDLSIAIQESKDADNILEAKIAETQSMAATALADEITRVETAYAAADTELSNNLDKEIARATATEIQNLADAKSYIDKVKNDLLGEGISETFDTLVEIQDWINGDGVNATELASAIANEATSRQTQDTILSDRIDALIAQHRTDIDTINNEVEKAYDQQTEAFNNYISEVKAELEEDDRNSLAEAKSYTDAAKSALFGEGSANYDTIVKLSAKTQELINTRPTYVAEQIAISETNIKTYLDEKIGAIENGAY